MRFCGSYFRIIDIRVRSPAASSILSPFIAASVHLIVGALICTFSVVGWAETLSGRVVGVSNGDTLTVLDTQTKERKVRVAGIDVPEKNQAFGNRSKQNLSLLVSGKPVLAAYT